MQLSLPTAYQKIFLAFLCVVCAIAVNAQTDNNFSVLSSTSYTDKIAQLKKYKVPKNYPDKPAQAWYEEILKGRNKDLLDAFENNELVNDTFLLNRCNAVLKKITAANKKFKFDTVQLYLNRSVVANAACYGEGTIMLNLGLFLWIDNEDELAFVIAHEVAHQLLNHSDNKLKQSITMLTSDEFTEELKKIKKADYGRFERYRKLMKGLNVESGKHSTYRESEADSLGITLIKNAQYNTTTAAMVLLKLDKVEQLFSSDKLYAVKDFFTAAQIDAGYFNKKTKYNGLSAMKVTMNADKDTDSIKTHPDCAKRYGFITGNKPPPAVVCCTALNNIYKPFKERALQELVRYLYESNNLGLCMHLSIFALQNKYNPTVYYNFLSLCFSKLYYKDKNLERFNAANAAASAGSNLKELQDFLFDCSTGDLEKMAIYFLKNNSANTAEDFDFANMMYNTQVKMKDASPAYDNFKNKYPNSKYNYLITKK